MDDINKMMAAYAEDAVEYAAKLKKKLDYSAESIATLEQICDILHKAIPKTWFARFFMFKRKPSDETILQYSKMLGGYLGEVIIRNHGGKWSVEDFMNQGNTIVLTVGDTKIFPVGRVYKRLKEGSENNIQHYYLALLSAFSK
jgi:hypothetical protein